MPKGDFNKVALQLYWNRTSAWVLSCKFAAHFQNTSGRLLLVNWGSLEYPWRMDINWILIFDLTLDDKFGVIFIFD